MNKLFIFVLGAATGTLVTWKVLDKKYRELAEEEIKSVEEYYKSREEAKEHIVEVKDYGVKTEEPYYKVTTEVEDYKEKLEELGYSEEEVDDEGCIVFTEPGIDYIAPYVITPEEFGEIEGQLTRSWTLYADGILTDEAGNIVFEPEKEIGDALEHLGEYEDDCIHVRNENMECDIEILKHESTFAELNGEDS